MTTITNLSETTLGFFAAAYSILGLESDMIIEDASGKTYPVADIYKYLDSSIILSSVSKDKLRTSTVVISDYSWWIKNSLIPDTYDQIRFTNTKFLQGFITMSDNLGVDFRNYTAGLPFKNNKDGEFAEYVIRGYDIPSIFKLDYKPAEVLAYYTGLNESDPCALDFV
ncbi:MAG: hypothetical protein QM487_10700 [Candidatus Marithrix sp.]